MAYPGVRLSMEGRHWGSRSRVEKDGQQVDNASVCGPSRTRVRYGVLRFQLIVSVMSSSERVIKNEVRHTPPLPYPGGLIKPPVDAEVDATLAILLFSLRE